MFFKTCWWYARGSKEVSVQIFDSFMFRLTPVFLPALLTLFAIKSISKGLRAQERLLGLELCMRSRLLVQREWRGTFFFCSFFCSFFSLFFISWMLVLYHRKYTNSFSSACHKHLWCINMISNYLHYIDSMWKLQIVGCCPADLDGRLYFRLRGMS